MNVSGYVRGSIRVGRRIVLSALLFVAAVVSDPQSSTGNQPVRQRSGEPRSDDAGKLLQKIEAVSRQSRTASSATEYSEIIGQCDLILDSNPEKTEHVKYLKSLKSWALNRRAETRMELAERFEAIGNPDQARQITASARADLDAAITADESKWLAYRNRAMVLTQIGHYANAIADWTRVITLHPNSAESVKAMFNRGELRYAEKQFDDALADYRKVIEGDETDLAALNGCGNCLLALERVAESIEYFNSILEKDPANAGALVNRGDAWQKLFQWENARNDYRASLASSKSGRTLQRLAWLLATCPDESICDPDAALASAREAIALDGETAGNLDTLAAALAATGDFDRARDVQTRAIALMESTDKTYMVRQTLYQNHEKFSQPERVDQD